MKLSDLKRVCELKSDLDYLAGLARTVGGKEVRPRIIIEGRDLRPEIATVVLPSIFVAVETERRSVLAELEKLGVTVE